MSELPITIAVRQSCACGASIDVSAPEGTVKKYVRRWEKEHRGHAGAPHVSPAGATSGDVSLKWTPPRRPDVIGYTVTRVDNRGPL